MEEKFQATGKIKVEETEKGRIILLLLSRYEKMLESYLNLIKQSIEVIQKI